MSLSHFLMVVVDDEKEMANQFRKYLQRSGFNSNTSFTDSLLTFSYYTNDHRFHTIITGLQVSYV
jgi:DNA-binding response OmpR family regulator